jgi:hypothetical protein
MKKLALVLAALVLGCGRGPASPNAQNLVGQYVISSVDGKPLPFAMQDSSSLVSSTMSLRADDSYQEVMTLEKGGETTDRTFTGIYASDGRLVVFRISTGGPAYSMDVVDGGSTLVENDENGVIVYVRK